ncbi:MAG: hypothetical protein JXA60_12150 [Candidatus Coatesbacteria bacterium]|nr:hypothetical protein [Candidatus Coatesbacteria bacterium]
MDKEKRNEGCCDKSGIQKTNFADEETLYTNCDGCTCSYSPCTKKCYETGLSNGCNIKQTFWLGTNLANTFAENH